MHESLFGLALALCCSCAAGASASFAVTSDFKNNGPMARPHAYTGEGQNVSIPLKWEKPPEKTQSLAIAVVDLHPIANHWVHWLVVDIPPQTREMLEGASGTSEMPGTELVNSFGETGYGGPMPPPGSGSHRYEVTVYALSVPSLKLPKNTTLNEFKKAIAGKVLGEAVITGTYQR